MKHKAGECSDCEKVGLTSPTEQISLSTSCPTYSYKFPHVRRPIGVHMYEEVSRPYIIYTHLIKTGSVSR